MIKQVVLDVEGITVSGQLYLPDGEAPWLRQDERAINIVMAWLKSRCQRVKEDVY